MCRFPPARAELSAATASVAPWVSGDSVRGPSPPPFAPCSPSTQLIASTTLLLPGPFGPTTQVIPGSRRRVVAEAKD